MTRRQHLEDDLHMAVAQFLGVDHNLALPNDATWTTIEHGGHRGKREAARLKAKGLRAGWPDIEIIWHSQSHLIELKAGKQRVTDAQLACHDDLVTAGALVAVCRSVEAVEGTLRGWGFPLRATTAARAA